MSYPRYEKGLCFGVISDSQCTIVIYKSYIICSGIYCVKMYNSTSGNYSEKSFKSVVTAMSRYEDRLAIGFEDGSICVFLLNSETMDISQASLVFSASGHTSGVKTICIEDDYVCSSSKNDILVHSIQAQQSRGKLVGHVDQVTHLDIYTTEDKEICLLSSSKDTLIKIWSIESMECLETAIGHRGEIWDFCLVDTPEVNKKSILSAGNDGVMVWLVDFTNIGRTDKSCFLESTLTNARTVALKMFGSILFTATASKCVMYTLGSKRKEAKLSYKQICESFHQSFVKSIALVKRTKETMKYVVCTVNNALEVNLLNTESNSVESLICADKKGHKHEIRICAISQDDMFIATASKTEIIVWNIKNRQNPLFVRNIELIGTRSLIFVPGNQFILAGDEKGKLHTIEVDNDNTEEINAHQSQLWQIQCLSDNKGIITCGDKRLNLYQFKLIDRKDSTTVPLELTHHSTAEFPSSALSCSSNPEFIAVGLLDNTIRLLYKDSLKPYLVLYGHNLPATHLYFMRNVLVSGSADKSIRLWGLDYGDCRKILKIHSERLSCVSELKHDGFLASAEGPVTTCISSDKKGNILYWDAQNWQIVQKFTAHRGDVTSMAAATHGDWFISVGRDRVVSFWNRTDDEVYIEEEFGREMDAAIEQEMVASSGQPVAALKSGEKLLDAIELAAKALNGDETSIKIFKQLGKSPSEFLLCELERCKLPDLEAALTLLKYEHVETMFTFIEECLDHQWNIVLVARVAIFLTNMYQKQLSLIKNMSSKLRIVGDKLQTNLKQHRDIVGINMAVLSLKQ